MLGLDKAMKRQQPVLHVALSWHASSRFPYRNEGIETGRSGPPN